MPALSEEHVRHTNQSHSLEKACEALGLPIRDDNNDPDGPVQGYFKLDATVDERGERLSAYHAYLNKRIALERQANLTICTGVVGSKLEVNGKTRQVTGVYLRSIDPNNTKKYLVKARREVIISNGTLRSPQMLLLR